MKKLLGCAALAAMLLVGETASAQRFVQRTVVRGNGFRRPVVVQNFGFAPASVAVFPTATTFVAPSAIYGFSATPFGFVPAGGCGGFGVSGFAVRGGGCW